MEFLGRQVKIYDASELRGEGTYAFVEFRDEELRETAMLFSGMEFLGRQVKIYAANGYVQPLIPVVALKPPAELLKKLNVPGNGGESPEARKLYVGNLASAVTTEMLTELFTIPLQTLPGHETTSIPPVIEVKFDFWGHCAFIEFRNSELTTLALSLFDGTELCGRPLKVGRPTGYVALTPDVPATALPALTNGACASAAAMPSSAPAQPAPQLNAFALTTQPAVDSAASPAALCNQPPSTSCTGGAEGSVASAALSSSAPAPTITAPSLASNPLAGPSAAGCAPGAPTPLGLIGGGASVTTTPPTVGHVPSAADGSATPGTSLPSPLIPLAGGAQASQMRPSPLL